MKYAILVGTSVAFVAAQGGVTFPDGFPQCGTTCITNMLGEAKNLGCDPSDISCLCSNTDFIYGVRDCSDQSCGTTNDASKVKEFGLRLCRDKGVSITGIPGDVGSATSIPATTTVVATGSPTVTKEPGATGTESTGSQPTESATPGGGAGVPLTTLFTTTGTNTDGTPFTSTGTTTVEGTVSATTVTSPVPSPTDGQSTNGQSSEAQSTEATTSTDTAAPSDAATSTSSQGVAAAQRTAAPVLLVAAGLAALVL